MSAPYSLRTLAHPEVAPDTILAFGGLGTAALFGGAAAAMGMYVAAIACLLVMVVCLDILNRVDNRARELEARTTR